MSKIDLQKYFDNALTFTFKDKEYVVDSSNRAYQLCQTQIKQITKEDPTNETAILDAVFNGAFGDKYKEIKELDLPAKAYNDMALEIMSEWSGISKEAIQEQMKIPSSR